ncbi:MAG: hydroxyisourate hydrolase [Solirubrobacteraceae bacterium]|nr:hydroxyisourate hydrolase [Solirubrobacteraceae bacterium]
MKPISLSTHVLDTARGRPVERVPVTVDMRDGDGWTRIGEGRTDEDGRVAELVPPGAGLAAGTYRLTFDLRATPSIADGWYPEVSIVVDLDDAGGHSHVPLLLAPYGYSTYRGS